MEKISNIITKNFVKEFHNHKNILGVTNYEYNNAFNSNKWIGNYLCGPSTVICCYLLKDYNYKVYKNIYGFGEIQEDHTFIIINNTIYVDPTYLQFLDTNSNLPSYYIGTFDDLKDIINNNSELKSLRLWNKTNEITNKINDFINKHFDKTNFLS